MTPGEEACQHLNVSLKEYFESKMKALGDSMRVSKEEFENRLHAMNELREQVLTDRGMFATRELHDKLQTDLSELARTVASLQTKLVTFIGAMGLFNTLIVALLVYHFSKQG